MSYKDYIKYLLLNRDLIIVSDNPEEFTLKSGEKSNFYINLKDIVRYPKLLSAITVYMAENIKRKYSSLENLYIAGIPYGGISLATNISILLGIPQLTIRKEAKTYGTKKIIEGLPIDNTKPINLILIEDVISSGTSVTETINILKSYKQIHIVDILSIVYRGESHSEYHFKYIFRKDDLLNVSYEPIRKIAKIDECEELPLLSKINQLKQSKESNIILAYDKPDFDSLTQLLTLINHRIIGLKIHNEILKLSSNQYYKLHELCKEYEIFLWEDRKFNDIGNTVLRQIENYINNIDVISIVPTGGITNELFAIDELNKFVLCEMSTENNMFNSNLTNHILYQYFSINHKHRVGNTALICQDEELINYCNMNNIATVRPGINILQINDSFNQKYTNPENVSIHPTMYVVGRGITNAMNPVKAVEQYLDITMK